MKAKISWLNRPKNQNVESNPFPYSQVAQGPFLFSIFDPKSKIYVHFLYIDGPKGKIYVYFLIYFLFFYEVEGEGGGRSKLIEWEIRMSFR